MSHASPRPMTGSGTDEPVAVIPSASAAPLEGAPDGERIDLFTLAPKTGDSALEEASITAFGVLRDSVFGKPLTSVAAAFALGYLLSRMRR